MIKNFESKIKAVAEKIAQDYEPDRIILFGSYAWGQPGPDSDVDLLVIKDTDSPRRIARAIDGSIFPRPFPIDLIVYTSQYVKDRLKIGDFFVNDIINNGKILYERG